MYSFKVLGIPQAKQSARFRAMKFGGRTVVKSYQKKEVIENERNISYDIKQQLPLGFVPLSGDIYAKVVFVFPVLKSFNKREVLAIKSGVIKFKKTKPDLVDNLMKGLFDAMKGIAFNDDAEICKTSTVKIYGEVPMTIIEIGYASEDNGMEALTIHKQNILQ